MNEAKYSGLSREEVIIPAYTTVKVDYNITKPNYYRVQNMGHTPIYCGTSRMPTAKTYDFMCNAESMKMYAEPFNRTFLYLYNPSGTEVNATIVSFSAPFDPLTLALSEISFDLPTADIGISTTISSFETGLPEGNNKIGSVDLSGVKMNDVSTAFSFLASRAYLGQEFPNMTNLHSLKVKLEEVIAKLVENKVELDLSVIEDKLEYIYNSISPALVHLDDYCFESHIKTITDDAGAYHDILPAEGNYISEINFLSNDSVATVTITIEHRNGTIETFGLFSKEVINSLVVNAKRIRIADTTGNPFSARIAYIEKGIY